VNNYWYNELGGFFDADYIKEYSNILTAERTSNEVSFIENCLSLKKNQRILDCPCGYGRHFIELTKRGYPVVGLDINNPFLKKAKNGLGGDQKNYLVNGDMRKLCFIESFDVAINLFTSIGYFESEKDDHETIKQISNALRPSGLFVIDTINKEYFSRYYKKKEKKYFEGGKIIKERFYDHFTGKLKEKKTKIFHDGRVKQIKWSLGLYSISELFTIIKKAGMTPIKAYEGFKEIPATNASKRIVVIAKKY
jgi:SAM-dependent methyltransferase